MSKEDFFSPLLVFYYNRKYREANFQAHDKRQSKQEQKVKRMETIHAVEFKGITKRFGSNIANDKVDLYLDKGIIMSLLGENGSGKTTLMNMLAGIYFPDEGQIFIDGKPVSIASPKDAFANGIGMIHQHFKLIDVFTAAENIVLGLKGRGKARSQGGFRKG